MSTLKLVAVASVVGVLALGVGRCSGVRDGKQAADQAWLIKHGETLAKHTREMRDTAEAIARVRAESERRLTAERTRLTDRLGETRELLAGARDVLADSAATHQQTRDALRLALAAGDSLTIQVGVYVATVDSVQAVHARERAALYSVIAAQDSSLANNRVLLNAMRNTSRCRVLGFVPCPTRVQSYLLGAASVAALVVAVR